MAMLEAPLPGQAHRDPTPAQLEAEGAQFMQFMNTMKGGK